MKCKFLNSLVLLFFFSLPFNSLSDDSLKIAIENPLRGNENINRDKIIKKVEFTHPYYDHTTVSYTHLTLPTKRIV